MMFPFRMPFASDQFVRSRFAGYVLAVLVVGAAALLRLGLNQFVPLTSPFLLFFAAVMVAASLGGLGPGVLAAVLAAVASDLFMTEWPPSLGDLRIVNPAQLILFLAEGVFVSLLGSMFYRARRQAEVSDAAARKLEQRILEISEDERRRIGHDLHDGLGQHLTGIALLTKALRQRLATLDLPEADQAARIAQLVNDSIGRTRDLARGLSPFAPDVGDLVRAMEDLAANASKLPGVSCVFASGTEQIPLDSDACVHLYRIAQEAINNSVKHGKAKSIQIALTASDGQVIMTITDDGSGLSEKTRMRPGLGLQIMAYRARMIAAKLSVVRAAPSGGTIVTCVAPAPATNPKDHHVE